VVNVGTIIKPLVLHEAAELFTLAAFQKLSISLTIYQTMFPTSNNQQRGYVPEAVA
jgi:hypothetical protein